MDSFCTSRTHYDKLKVRRATFRKLVDLTSGIKHTITFVMQLMAAFDLIVKSGRFTGICYNQHV